MLERGRDRSRECFRRCSNRRRSARGCRATQPTSTGLVAGTPIVAGAGDQAAGAVGMGITRPGAVSATIGTSGVVFAATDRPALDPRGRLHTFCHAIPGRWHVMGVTQAAGLSLRWVRDQWCGTGPAPSYDELTREAAAAPAGADGVLWAPYLMGERTPHCDPHVRARARRPRRASRPRPHRARRPRRRCVQPARHVHDFFRARRCRSSGSVSAVAGRDRCCGARSRPTSTAMPSKPSRPTKAPRTAPRYSPASAPACGRASTNACDALVHTADRVTPDPAGTAIMNERYVAYRRIYPALQQL